MIRYNGLVLKPTGSFQTDADAGSGGVIWWNYLILSAGILCALVLVAVLILLGLLIVKKKTRSNHKPLVTVN